MSSFESDHFYSPCGTSSYRGAEWAPSPDTDNMAGEVPDNDPTQQGAAWSGEGGYGVAEDLGPTHVQLSDHLQAQEPDFSVATAMLASGDSPSFDGGGAAAAGDVGDYDPESVIPNHQALNPQATEDPAFKPSPQPASKKPKTAGGFLVGDSDSEDESPTPASSSNELAAAEPAAPALSLKPSPLHNSTSAQDVPGPPSNLPSASQVNTVSRGSVSAGAAGEAGAVASFSAAAAALPHDTIGLLEARVREDPRGSLDAWLALVAEHRRRNRIDDARAVYNRFLEVFPQSADVWIAYIEMELDNSDFVAAEALFGKSLKDVLHVQLWTVYLDYIRRRNDLTDSSGQGRLTVSQAYEFVLDNVGIDKDSGRIWQDYIQFIRLGPGNIGGSGWQDQQKMDQLRKAYQRAICVPISNVNTLWKEYDQFEMGLNKMTGRKFLAERSPAYMTAKSANTALENITRGLRRSNLPRLPPMPGFEGDQDYAEQVDLWRKWIAWEKSDPLELKSDEPDLLRQRILYCYKQALMALRFWPEMFVDAAEWCFENNVTEDGKDKGMDFLLRGIGANPESILLALKHADRIELTYPAEDSVEAKIAQGKAVREPYDKILGTLYSLSKSLKEKEKADIQRIEEAAAAAMSPNLQDEDEDEDTNAEREAKSKAKEEQIALVRHGISAQLDLLSKSLTFVWTALARAMRRIQGKGDLKGQLGGLRGVFQDARVKGRLGGEIYVAIAKMEWKCYNDKAGGKIFDRGARLFPEDPYFMIEYIKYLIAHNDITNSRVVFETCVNRLTQKPENVHKAKPLLSYMHKREAEYGDLARVVELEKRMATLYPDDPKLARFSARFSTEMFDPIAARIIVSPAAQLRPKMIMPSIERGQSIANSPRPGLRQPNSPHPQLMPATNSPKRPFPVDDFEEVINPPRKIARGGDQREFQRGESPLKGAAGRRLNQQRQLHGQGPVSAAAPPPPLPTMVTFLLNIIPSAAHYNGERYNGARLVRLIQETDVDINTWEARRARGGRPGDQGGGRHAGPSHGRQLSAEYAPPTYQGRNSPSLRGRPLSPFGGGGGGGDRGRLVPASVTYRQTSLRPESRDSYEPPPTTLYRQEPPSYGPTPTQYDSAAAAAAAAAAGWQQPPPVAYGAPPPPQGYPAAPHYQQPPPQQGPPYGNYRF